MDRIVLLEFLQDLERMHVLAATIRASIGAGNSDPAADIPVLLDESAPEGRLLLVRHLRRERSPRLRKHKIAAVSAAGRPVACEVCRFDFGATHGDLGRDYIEVHHVLPLHASGPTQTRLDDLCLLCANCHRMIHRSRPWLTPTALADLVVTGQTRTVGGVMRAEND